MLLNDFRCVADGPFGELGRAMGLVCLGKSGGGSEKVLGGIWGLLRDLWGYWKKGVGVILGLLGRPRAPYQKQCD